MSKSVYLEKCKRYREMLRGQAGWAEAGQGAGQGRQIDRQTTVKHYASHPPSIDIEYQHWGI